MGRACVAVGVVDLVSSLCVIMFAMHSKAERRRLMAARDAVGGAVDRGARDEEVCARVDGVGDCGFVDAAIHFDIAGDMVLFHHSLEAADFGEHGRDELLAAEAGVDGHDEDHISVLQDFFEGDEGVAGLRATPTPLPSVADLLDGAVEVGASLDVDDYEIGTRFGEIGDVELGPLDHQVGFDGDWAEWANSSIMTRGPTVMLGTKWPSITSTWMRPAPDWAASCTCSPRRAKSAERIDGTISILRLV